MDLFVMTVLYVIVLSVLFPAVYCGLTDNCPSEFNLTADPSRKVTLKVKQNKSYCLSIMERRADIRKSSDDLDLTLGIPYSRDDGYYLNISWPVKENRKNNQFPMKYGIFLTYSIREQNILFKPECIVLELKNRTATPRQNSLTLNLDCIKLFNNTREGVFSMDVWKDSGKCERRRRERRRSGCDTMERSETSRYKLSLDRYKHQICSCHYACHNSKPGLRVGTIEDGDVIDFEIFVTNLPDFLLSVVITITAKGIEKRSYRFEQFHILQNRSLEFITDHLPRVTETYHLLLFYECILKRDDDVAVSSGCHSSDSFNFTLTQVKEDSLQNTNVVKKIGIIPIVCGLIVFCLTIVVMVIYSCLPYICRIVKGSAGVVFINNNTINEERDYDRDLFEVDLPTTERESLLQTSDKQLSAILVCHDADMEAVHIIIKENLLKKNTELKDGRGVNWKESAFNLFTPGSDFYDVIIFVSVGLLELLYGPDKVKQTRLKERLYENAPDVILSCLKTLDDTTRCKCAIHIVSTKSDQGKELVHNFKSKFKSIDRLLSYSYYFQKSDLDSDENQREFRGLLCNLQNHERFESDLL